jgi:hypothetical protein
MAAKLLGHWLLLLMYGALLHCSHALAWQQLLVNH